jgi:hypothetical protein
VHEAYLGSTNQIIGVEVSASSKSQPVGILIQQLLEGVGVGELSCIHFPLLLTLTHYSKTQPPSGYPAHQFELLVAPALWMYLDPPLIHL